ncbi:hypothetical protein QUC31_011290 [Theobroma cacao]|uniref:Uncharacterized protein LOC18597770 isoform X1 n=2 Tax=Theobroma cacao TaxID=3641 RepID=A0AB32V348_THECC|nr:PREDICTED: uncharacterized protein LOC18597770 isoform X1 [Theobroma cacao]EOY07541.1 Uncharacterized protein TCM_021949 isoform 1 [Theobroma cacao]WRX23369.1 hypothetical protein QQP08_015856 [Theobroma cacao]
MNSVNSPIAYTVEDKDLDDAALWAVIDSAAASHSSSKHRKTLAIKFPNHQSPLTPASHPSPPQKIPHQNPSHHLYSPPNTNHRRLANAGEDYHRPYKIARSCASEVSESSPMAIVQRTPIASFPEYRSPETYLSPGFGGNGSEVSLESCGRSDEKEGMRHSLSGKFPSVELFKEYQNAAMAILEKSDYTMISGNPFIKKSGWRKISFYFNLSFEIKDKNIEFDENRNVQRAEFVVRAYMQGGRFSDGWGSCERREKRFLKPNHDIPSTAETRAKNKACQDLLGIGEYRPGASQFRQ